MRRRPRRSAVIRLRSATPSAGATTGRLRRKTERARAERPSEGRIRAHGSPAWPRSQPASRRTPRPQPASAVSRTRCAARRGRGLALSPGRRAEAAHRGAESRPRYPPRRGSGPSSTMPAREPRRRQLPAPWPQRRMQQSSCCCDACCGGGRLIVTPPGRGRTLPVLLGRLGAARRPASRSGCGLRRRVALLAGLLLSLPVSPPAHDRS